MVFKRDSKCILSMLVLRFYNLFFIEKTIYKINVLFYLMNVFNVCSIRYSRVLPKINQIFKIGVGINKLLEILGVGEDTILC